MSEPDEKPRRFGPAVITYVLAVLAAIVVSIACGTMVHRGPDGPEGWTLFYQEGVRNGVPLEFAFFVLILLGVALFHHHTMVVALCGLGVISVYKILALHGFHFTEHMHHEWQVAFNSSTGRFEVGAATKPTLTFPRKALRAMTPPIIAAAMLSRNEERNQT